MAIDLVDLLLLAPPFDPSADGGDGVAGRDIPTSFASAFRTWDPGDNWPDPDQSIVEDD